MTPCSCCATRIAKKDSPSHLSGLYALACLHCAAALVLSARPSRLHQEAMFAAIARVRNAPSRSAVIAQIRSVGNEREANSFTLQP